MGKAKKKPNWQRKVKWQKYNHAWNKVVKTWLNIETFEKKCEQWHGEGFYTLGVKHEVPMWKLLEEGVLDLENKIRPTKCAKLPQNTKNRNLYEPNEQKAMRIRALKKNKRWQLSYNTNVWAHMKSMFKIKRSQLLRQAIIKQAKQGSFNQYQTHMLRYIVKWFHKCKAMRIKVLNKDKGQNFHACKIMKIKP